MISLISIVFSTAEKAKEKRTVIAIYVEKNAGKKRSWSDADKNHRKKTRTSLWQQYFVLDPKKGGHKNFAYTNMKFASSMYMLM